MFYDNDNLQTIFENYCSITVQETDKYTKVTLKPSSPASCSLSDSFVLYMNSPY